MSVWIWLGITAFIAVVVFVVLKRRNKKNSGMTPPVVLGTPGITPEERWAGKPGKGQGAQKDHPQGKEYGWEKNADKRPDECPACGQKVKKDKKDKE